MTLDPQSPLARALAELEGTMQSSGTAVVSPERRRAAHRLGDLVRSSDTELARFAKRHLPGREVDEAALVDARTLAILVERLVSLLGRSSEANGATSRFAVELGVLLPELERNAAAVAPPTFPALPLAPPMPPFEAAPLEAAPLEAAAPPAAASAPYFEPAPLSVGPPNSVAPGSDTLDVPSSEAAIMVARPAALPFENRSPSITQVEPDCAVGAEIPIALPFATSSSAPAAPKAHAAGPIALPFRQQALDGRAAESLPEHLAKLELASYATLRALIELFPERTGEIFAHYRIPNEATALHLASDWQRRIAADAAVRSEWDAQYQAAFEHYGNRPR